MEHEIILQKVSQQTRHTIITGTNAMISKVPFLYNRLLKSDRWGLSDSLWIYDNNGYYETSFLGDHAEVLVLYWGKDIHEVVNNMIHQQIDLYLSFDYQLTHPDDMRSFHKKMHDFLRDCNNYIHLDAPSYKSFTMKQLNISDFLKSIGTKMKDEYKTHCVFYDRKLGYLYTIKLANGYVKLYKLGMTIPEADHLWQTPFDEGSAGTL